jgi:hypothetical protein
MQLQDASIRNSYLAAFTTAPYRCARTVPMFRKFKKFIAFGFVSLGLAVTGASAGTPADAAEGFYAVYASFHPSDGIPDAAGRAKFAPYISPALEALLKRGDDAEKNFAKANKDSPPLIEGDLFTSMFEGATAHKLGVCKQSGDTARCAVELTYSGGKEKPFHWSDTAVLIKTKDGWRVDDIIYGGTWDFGNKGRMTDTLRQAIADAGG